MNKKGANMFRYITSLQLHRGIQSLTVFVCVHQAAPDIKREDDQENESFQT